MLASAETDPGYGRLPGVQQIFSPSLVPERLCRDPYSRWTGGKLLRTIHRANAEAGRSRRYDETGALTGWTLLTGDHDRHHQSNYEAHPVLVYL